MDNTVCELFAGVGGFRLGLEKSGFWKVIWANQWEPSKKAQHAFDCYASHFKTGIHINEDIAKVPSDSNSEDAIPPHTLLVGGFPCQDYSVARTQAKGIQGKKGVLWWEIYRIIKDKSPKFVLLENVDRLLKSPAKQRGRDFGIILSCFTELGYSVEWRVINAADYGFPQKRRRTFIFACHNSTSFYQRQGKVEELQTWLHDDGLFQYGFPIEYTFDQALSTTISSDVLSVSTSFSFDFKTAGIMREGKIYTQQAKPVLTPSLPISELLEENVSEEFYISEANLEKWTYLKGSKRETRISRTTGYEYKYTEGAIPFPDAIDGPSRTLLTSESSVNRSTHVIKDPATGRLRLLTPLECERLNGFDDNWTNTGMPQKFRYFCMGNALVVGVIEKIGRTLSMLARLENQPTEAATEERLA